MNTSEVWLYAKAWHTRTCTHTHKHAHFMYEWKQASTQNSASKPALFHKIWEACRQRVACNFSPAWINFTNELTCELYSWTMSHGNVRLRIWKKMVPFNKCGSLQYCLMQIHLPVQHYDSWRYLSPYYISTALLCCAASPACSELNMATAHLRVLVAERDLS